MGKLFYCKNCLRVIDKEDVCDYCKSQNLSELTINAPVNIIGSKLKGKVLKLKENEVRLLVKDESNNKFIKEYKADEIRKII